MRSKIAIFLIGQESSRYFGNMTGPPKFLHHFTQNWKNIHSIIKDKQSKKSNIRFTNKHISTFGMQKYNLLWHSAVKMSQNDNFFVP